MQKSLMVDMNEKNLQAVINTYSLKPFYYPTLFPLQETPFLTWKTLEAQAGLKIAADIVARGATIPRKTREAIAKMQGDIPKIAVSREKLEDELTEYDILVAMASNNADLRALVEFWAEDTQFCWDGVAARAEWLALKSISLGKVSLSSLNNAAVVSPLVADYNLLSTQKIGVNTSWAGTTGKPLTKDFPAALKAGKDLFGASYKFAFMNIATLAKLVAQEEVVKACASYLQNLSGVAQEPDLIALNTMLSRKVNLNGLQIVPIDQDITIEINGARTSGNPFEDDVVMFSESKVLGKTFWKKPIDMNVQSPAIKVMNGHTCIKKYSEDEPVKEVTMGIANLFPVWNSGTRSVLMQVNNTTWDK